MPTTRAWRSRRSRVRVSRSDESERGDPYTFAGFHPLVVGEQLDERVEERRLAAAGAVG